MPTKIFKYASCVRAQQSVPTTGIDCTALHATSYCPTSGVGALPPTPRQCYSFVRKLALLWRRYSWRSVQALAAHIKTLGSRLHNLHPCTSFIYGICIRYAHLHSKHICKLLLHLFYWVYLYFSYHLVLSHFLGCRTVQVSAYMSTRETIKKPAACPPLLSTFKQ